MHTAIRRADVDAAGRYAVTGSDDKTVRVWSVDDGRLLRTIRLPAGPGNVGKVYAVAISPDGELIAAGGWTRWTDADHRSRSTSSTAPPAPWSGASTACRMSSTHLTFSPDGRHLAATLGGANGLRVYDRDARLGRGRPRHRLWRRQLRRRLLGRRPAGDDQLRRPRPAVRSQLPARREGENGRRTAALRHRLQPRRDEARGRLR